MTATDPTYGMHSYPVGSVEATIADASYGYTHDTDFAAAVDKAVTLCPADPRVAAVIAVHLDRKTRV